jgi:hypothetical protein
MLVDGQRKGKKNKDPQHPLLSFDKACMTCAGQGGQATSQIPQLIKAFKMACLSYQPSKVIFESKTFERN